MNTENEKWFNGLTSEMKFWLSQKLNEGKLSLDEILSSFRDVESFPSIKERTTLEHLKWFAKKELPGWKEPPSLEQRVIEQIEQIVPQPLGEFISEEEKEKINTLQKHRLVLKELFENYKHIKIMGNRGADTSKARFLELISRELIIIEELQQKEKGLQSMLGEIKKVEMEEPVEEFVDYINGYCLPLLVRKARESASEKLRLLREKVELMEKIVESGQDLEEVIKDYLQQVYGGGGEAKNE